MPYRELPSPLSEQQLQAAMRDAARATLAPLTATMAGFFCLLAVAALLMGFGSLAWPLAALELSTAALMGGIFLAVRRYRVPHPYVHAVLFGIAIVAVARAAAQLYVFASPRDSSNFAVILAATGFFSLSLGWSTAIVAVCWTLWLAIALSVHPDAEWTHYGFFLGWATVLGGVVQYVRRRLLRRLFKAEARHQVLVEHLPVISYLDDVGSQGRPLYISPQIERVLGYTPAEWCRGHDFWKDRIYPADRERVLAEVRAHSQSQSSREMEYRILTRDGNVVWVQDHSTHIIPGDGQRRLIYGTMIEVTERKRAEALRVGANRVFEKLAAGASTSEVLTVLLRASEEIHPGMVASVLALGEDNCLQHIAAPSLPLLYQQAIDGTLPRSDHGPWGQAVYFGKRVVVDDIATDPNWGEHRAAALAHGLQACWSEPIRSSDGGVTGVLTIYYRPPYLPRPADAELILTAARLSGLAIERALTEAVLRNHREHLEELVAERTRQLEASLEQLRHSERLASVGTLAAGIAHEINNPVGMMLLSAEQALHCAGEPGRVETVRQLLREIVSNAKRCGQIVKGVLRFARHEPAERSPGNVNAVIEQAVELTRVYAKRHNGRIETSLAPTLPALLLNRVELEQVVVNLIRNGLEAGAPSPQVTITTAHVESAVQIIVSDNGRGVADEDRSRIFDPFYTTRQSIGGTGLGLSLSYGIVTDHGGTIRVEDAPGGGTSMIVELPVRQNRAAAHSPLAAYVTSSSTEGELLG